MKSPDSNELRNQMQVRFLYAAILLGGFLLLFLFYTTNPAGLLYAENGKIFSQSESVRLYQPIAPNPSRVENSIDADIRQKGLELIEEVAPHTTKPPNIAKTPDYKPTGIPLESDGAGIPQVQTTQETTPGQDLSTTTALLKEYLSKRNQNGTNQIALLMSLLKESLQMLPNPSRPTSHSHQILIATTWRSGSTFLENLLSSHKGTLDIYEPLMQFEFSRIEKNSQGSEEALELIHDILNCRVRNSKFLSTLRRITDMANRFQPLAGICRNAKDRELCLDGRFLELSCQLFPFMVMKLVRAGLSLMSPILEDPNLNPYIIFLIRDPRAILNSRKNTVKWCQKPLCIDPLFFCHSMETDLDNYLKLKKQYPDRVHIVRYEDMSLEPLDRTRNLTQSIDWDLSPEMSDFISTHTTVEEDTPWTTARKSAERVMYWTKKLELTDVKWVQESCSSLMRRVGYLPVSSLDDLSVEDVLERPLVIGQS